MKKVIAIVLALATVLSFSACGLFNIDIGTESLEISQEQSAKKLNDLAKSTGYEISFKANKGEKGSEDQIITVGKKDNILWLVQNDSEDAIVFEEGKYHTYEKVDGEWQYNDSYEGDEANASDFTIAYTPWLYYGNAFDGSLKKLDTAKIAGRDCQIYTISVGIFSFKTEYKVYIDKEYGITMKLELNVSAGAEGSTSLSYEVTKFDTNVSAPVLPAPEKTDVE